MRQYFQQWPFLLREILQDFIWGTISIPFGFLCLYYHIFSNRHPNPPYFVTFADTELDRMIKEGRRGYMEEKGYLAWGVLIVFLYFLGKGSWTDIAANCLSLVLVAAALVEAMLWHIAFSRA